MNRSRLAGWERVLLFLPVPGGVAFGLPGYLFPREFALAVGLAGDDPYVLQLAAAGTFGFAVAAAVASVRGDWIAARALVAGILLASVVALPITILEIMTRPTPIAWAFLADWILQLVALGPLLYRHRSDPAPEPDIPRHGGGATRAVFVIVLVGTLASVGVGLLATLVPAQTAQFFGYHGTDAFIYRLGGAETFGYTTMGMLMLRWRTWRAAEIPVLNVVIWTGLSLIATIFALARGDPPLLAAIVGLVCIVVTPVGTWLLLRRPWETS